MTVMAPMPTPTPRSLTRDAVVVAVGPDEQGYEAALVFAVEEARRAGRPLHLVHAARPGGRRGRSLLRAAMTRAVALVADDDLPVTASLVDHGTLVRALVDSADAGSLTVLQHRRLAPAQRPGTRSVVGGVAARALVPVVAVPEDWTPRPASDRVVTVGVQDSAEAGTLIRVAASVAARRGARLEVLHASWSGSEPTVVGAIGRHLGQDATLEVQHSPPVVALLDAADRSDLLVLGRRHHLLPQGTHLGPVARAVLDHSRCPVLVAPEPGTFERSAVRAETAC